jgi:EmrB/QacA subfamily drug resistance transporter
MKRKGFTLLAMCMCAFIISMDTTIVNVSLPALVRQLHATTTDLQWVVDAYSLAFAALVLVVGSLSDRLGRKGMLLAGLGVFGAASLAGSFGTTAGQLIAARSVMGIGAAMIFPSTLSLLTNVFTARRERAVSIGLWGATTGIGIALGPIIGGALLDSYWWGSIFLFMAPVAAVVAAVVAWQVPTSRDTTASAPDWLGFALSTAGMGLLIFGIIQAPGWGWASASAIGTIVAGVAILAVFGLVESKLAAPMLDVRLFRNMRFTAASVSVAIAFFALMGFIFLMTQYFQVIKTYSPLSTGVRLLPVALSVGIFSVLGTRLAVKIGNKVVVGTGLLFYSVAFAWISTVSQTTSYLVLAVQMVVLGTGMGLTASPATESIMGAVPVTKAGVGSAVNDATRLFGATLGVAVIGSVAGWLYTSKLADLLPPHVPPSAVAAAKGSVGGAAAAAQQLSQHGLVAQARGLFNAAQLAFLHGLAGGCAIASGMTAAGILLAVFFLPAWPRPLPAQAADQSSPSKAEAKAA